ncbi:hypothetical protein RHGRI_002997 [Rhododendron griersonianum]|uniref:Uncharacterized protein n=1 Tax=Rhododendron griersonianum TaxID=479676 RepID=A0AAV6LS96_9ERIC|nr:hypothetical protein RHGRI_002997 [Rhododendron griersonianum]
MDSLWEEQDNAYETKNFVNSLKIGMLNVRSPRLVERHSILSLKVEFGGGVNVVEVVGICDIPIETRSQVLPIFRFVLKAGENENKAFGNSPFFFLHCFNRFGHGSVCSSLLKIGDSLICEAFRRAFREIGRTRNFHWGHLTHETLWSRNSHRILVICVSVALGGSMVEVLTVAKLPPKTLLSKGEVYTWGFGRGGRLGHPDFDIHSGQAAVITPRLVTSGLGARKVKAIAAAKHHTVVATEGGDVFTWGSNREGQLGYTSVDTQPTPRRVSSLRSKIVAVAAANKHTAVVSDSGEVFTWGCNKEGQLGYGTSNSASNYTPRLIEYLKGKVFVGVVAAKYHTIVLGADGEVFTWGHRLVTPRRVVIARNIKKMGNTQLKFHSKERLHVISIAAGMVHSWALTDDGALFYWVSSDPDLRCRQLYSLCGSAIVSVSSGKHWTAAVTATGSVYMWDGKKGKDEPPIAARLHGIKRATWVAVGETHLLIIGSLYHPVYPPSVVHSPQKLKEKVTCELDELEEDFMFNDMDADRILSTVQKDDVRCGSIPTLKSLCEKVAADFLVEPRNAMQLLEIADSLGAEDLRKHCEVFLQTVYFLPLLFSILTIHSCAWDNWAMLHILFHLVSTYEFGYKLLPTKIASFITVVDIYIGDHPSIFSTAPSGKNEQSWSLVYKTKLFIAKVGKAHSLLNFKTLHDLEQKLSRIYILHDVQSQFGLLETRFLLRLQRHFARLGSTVTLQKHTDRMQSDWRYWSEQQLDDFWVVSMLQKKRKIGSFGGIRNSPAVAPASGDFGGVSTIADQSDICFVFPHRDVFVLIDSRFNVNIISIHTFHRSSRDRVAYGGVVTGTVLGYSSAVANIDGLSLRLRGYRFHGRKSRLANKIEGLIRFHSGSHTNNPMKIGWMPAPWVCFEEGFVYVCADYRIGVTSPMKYKPEISTILLFITTSSSSSPSSSTTIIVITIMSSWIPELKNGLTLQQIIDARLRIIVMNKESNRISELIGMRKHWIRVSMTRDVLGVYVKVLFLISFLPSITLIGYHVPSKSISNSSDAPSYSIRYRVPITDQNHQNRSFKYREEKEKAYKRRNQKKKIIQLQIETWGVTWQAHRKNLNLKPKS